MVITYGIIDKHRQNHARWLVDVTIDMVKAKAVGRWDDAVHRAARAFMRENNTELPDDFWFGAWDGRELVGVAHTAPPVGTGSRMIPKAHPGARLPWAFTPEELVNYFTGNTILEEISVAPNYRGRGIGRRLFGLFTNEGVARV